VTPLRFALACQVALLAYHQVTTFADFFPFNGARFYSKRERMAEMGVNALLMGLAIVGCWRGDRVLVVYAVAYYFVLFALELVIWWVPYFSHPRGTWRRVYNGALAIGTSDFSRGDTLSRWLVAHDRIHGKTVTPLNRRPGHITPNLEHIILHGMTLVTAVATARAYDRL
jgi:hypothetical protein